MKTITTYRIKKIFNISDSTVRNYIENGILKVVNLDKDVYEHNLYDYEHICNILGLKQLPDEPFITTNEAIKVLNLSDSFDKGGIRAYCDRHKIPYYIFKNSKGTKTYFLRSELESSIKYKIRWGQEFPQYVSKNHFLREIFKVIMNYNFSSSLTEKQRFILEEIILNGKTVREISEKINIPYRICSNNFNEGCKKIFYQISMLNFNLSRLSELSKENVKLQLENNVLIGKLGELTKEEIPIERQKIENLSKTFDNDNLSARILGLLKRMEVKTLYDLTMFTRDEVLKYQNVGRKTIHSLDSILKQHKLDWKKEPEIHKFIKTEKKIKKIYKKTDLRSVKDRIQEIENKISI